MDTQRPFVPVAGLGNVYDNSTIACPIEVFLAGKDPYRVVAYGKFAIYWPFRTTWSQLAESSDMLSRLMLKCRQILLEQGVSYDRSEAKLLEHLGKSHIKAIESFVFYTKSGNTHAMAVAATEMQSLVDAERKSLGITTEICVEIRNPYKMYQDVSYIIAPGSATHRTCEKALPTILSHAISCFAGSFNALAWHMRGPRPMYASGARVLVATAMIMIEPGTVNPWAQLEKDFEKLVQAIPGLEVALSIKFRPGGPQRMINGDVRVRPPLVFLQPEQLPNIPTNGASIGPRNCQEAGSVGVFVDWKPIDRQQKSRKMFLTAYHVVGPGGQRDQHAHNDKFGIGLNGSPPGTAIWVDYPAKVDADATNKRLGELITIKNQPDKKGMKEVLLNIETHRKAKGLGTVCFASGYGRKDPDGRRLDWALIQLRDENAYYKKKNAAPALSQFSPQQLQLEGEGVQYLGGPENVIKRTKKAQKGLWVAKNGRTTGVTAGFINAMEVNFDYEGEITPEVEILATPGGDWFCLGGDSGSAVISNEQEWLGLLCWLAEEGASYMTPAASLINDIKEATGGEISLM